MSTTCDSYKGSAKAWPDFLTGIRGRVKLKESVFCRGKISFHFLRLPISRKSNLAYVTFSGCPDPGRYENGVVNSVGSGLESVLRYSCNPGYRLKGSVERECAIHGGWEGKEPKCESESSNDG